MHWLHATLQTITPSPPPSLFLAASYHIWSELNGSNCVPEFWRVGPGIYFSPREPPLAGSMTQTLWLNYKSCFRNLCSPKTFIRPSYNLIIFLQGTTAHITIIVVMYVSMTTLGYPFRMPLLTSPLQRHVLLSGRKKTETEREQWHELGPFRPHMPCSST